MNILLRAVFLLVGTTIGAGIFVLPYVFSCSGFLPAGLGLVFLGLVMLCVNYFYSQVILDTSGDHQLPGYVKKYLGVSASRVALVVMLISLYGALIAYCSLAGEFLHMVFGFGSVQFFVVIFIHAGMLLFLKGIKILTKIQSWLVCLMILLLLVIPIVLLGSVDINNFSVVGKRPLFFWGSTFFSLTGFSVIPEIEEFLRNKNRLLVSAVVIGSIIPVVLYAGFAFGVWGALGADLTEDTLTGLVLYSPLLARCGAVIGVLALLTSFLSLINVAKEVLYRDLKINERKAKFIALFPLIFSLIIPSESFISIISFTGAVSLAILGSFICLMFIKVRPKFKWFALLIIVIFGLGAVSVIL